jgi:hypothetical protein
MISMLITETSDQRGKITAPLPIHPERPESVVSSSMDAGFVAAD